MLRLWIEHAESFVITNHTIEASISGGVCGRRTKLHTVMLSSVNGVSSAEVDPFQGNAKVCGVRLAKNETYVHVHTTSGKRLALRVRREDLDSIVDQIVTRARAARALDAATSPSRAATLVSRFRSFGNGGILSSVRNMALSYFNSSSDILFLVSLR